MKKMTVQTLLLALAFLAATLIGGQLQQEKAFDIGDLSTVDIAQAEAAFEQSQSNEDLVKLVKALCWRLRVAEDEAASEPLAAYGQLLLDRAKAEQVDLEYVDNPDHMLQVLAVIRELGAQ